VIGIVGALEKGKWCFEGSRKSLGAKTPNSW